MHITTNILPPSYRSSASVASKSYTLAPRCVMSEARARAAFTSCTLIGAGGAAVSSDLTWQLWFALYHMHHMYWHVLMCIILYCINVSLIKNVKRISLTWLVTRKHKHKHTQFTLYTLTCIVSSLASVVLAPLVHQRHTASWCSFSI